MTKPLLATMASNITILPALHHLIKQTARALYEVHNSWLSSNDDSTSQEM